MKQQEQKYVVEVTKVVEAMKELKDNKDFYKTRLEKEREDQKRQDDAHAQHMELMQKGLLVVAQQLKERKLQHAKEMEEIWKAHADQAKLSNEECKMMTAEILTPKEKKQENIKQQQENRKKPQEHHQTMTKSSKTYKEETMDAEKHNVALMQHKSVTAVVAPVTIRE